MAGLRAARSVIGPHPLEPLVAFASMHPLGSDQHPLPFARLPDWKFKQESPCVFAMCTYTSHPKYTALHC